MFPSQSPVSSFFFPSCSCSLATGLLTSLQEGQPTEQRGDARGSRLPGRCRLVNVRFSKSMELSFVLHRASDETRFDSRIPLRVPRANRVAHILSRRDQTRVR